MNASLYKLDNPVWHALNETHERYSICYPGIKFYDPEFCPFGAFETGATPLPSYMSEYARLTDQFFIVGEKPGLPAYLEIRQQLSCLQMIIEAPTQLEQSHTIITLGHDHAAELRSLVNLVQPGYYLTGTRLMGEYYGIR